MQQVPLMRNISTKSRDVRMSLIRRLSKFPSASELGQPGSSQACNSEISAKWLLITANKCDKHVATETYMSFRRRLLPSLVFSPLSESSPIRDDTQASRSDVSVHSPVPCPSHPLPAGNSRHVLPRIMRKKYVLLVAQADITPPARGCLYEPSWGSMLV